MKKFEYYQEIEEFAFEAVKTAAKYGSRLEEVVSEQARSLSHTVDHVDVYRHSDNREAYKDLGETFEDVSQALEVAAVCAIDADIREETWNLKDEPVAFRCGSNYGASMIETRNVVSSEFDEFDEVQITGYLEAMGQLQNLKSREIEDYVTDYIEDGEYKDLIQYLLDNNLINY